MLDNGKVLQFLDIPSMVSTYRKWLFTFGRKPDVQADHP